VEHAPDSQGSVLPDEVLKEESCFSTEADPHLAHFGFTVLFATSASNA